MNNDEKFPGWVNAMKDWLNEDIKKRSVFMVAVDGVSSFNIVTGPIAPLLVATVVAIETVESIKNLIDAAKIAADAPLAKAIIGEAMEKYCKEHGIDTGLEEDLKIRYRGIIGKSSLQTKE